MAKPDTWMPLYIGDYLADTSRLTTEAHGAYLLLIMDYWRNGAPADNDEMLAAITKLPHQKWKKTRALLEPLFVVGEGRWRHKRVEEELEKAGIKIDKRKAAGRAGAVARWGKGDGESNANANGKSGANAYGNRMANAMPSQWQNDGPSPSPSPSPSPRTAAVSEGPERAIVDRFLALRTELWPNESGLPAPTLTLLTIARGWIGRGGSVELINEIVERGIRRMAESDPNAPTTLNAFSRSVEGAIGRGRVAGGAAAFVEKKPADESTIAEQRDRTVALFKRSGIWPDGFGPKPGEPGCLASPEVLRKFGFSPKDAA